MFGYITSTPERAAHAGLSSLAGNIQQNYPLNICPATLHLKLASGDRTPGAAPCLCLCSSGGGNTLTPRSRFNAALLRSDWTSELSLAERTCESGSG